MSLNTYVTATNCDRFSLSLNSTAFLPVAAAKPKSQEPQPAKTSNLSISNTGVKASAAAKTTAISSMNVAGNRTADDQAELFEKRDEGLPIMKSGLEGSGVSTQKEKRGSRNIPMEPANSGCC